VPCIGLEEVKQRAENIDEVNVPEAHFLKDFWFDKNPYWKNLKEDINKSKKALCLEGFLKSLLSTVGLLKDAMIKPLII